MLPLIGAALLASASVVSAQTDHAQLTGTWSSKSNTTMTGQVRFNVGKVIE
jgi:hypothetical protein